MIKVKKDGKYGYCNLKGQLVIPCKYDNAENFYDGEAMVASGDAYYINKKGEYIKPAQKSGSEETPKGEKFKKENISLVYILSLIHI